MAINENLTERIRQLLAHVPGVEEKKMFRGIAFMVNGKMCICAGNDQLLCRVDPSKYEELILLDGVSPMVMRGKEMKGYLNVNEGVVLHKKDLQYWVELCLEYNPLAKASPKKNKKKPKA